ncbi:hypothetical protein [Gracilibacillus sp. YIM 98692]|nr:hypothetical protein [Gracilibacillus sp. YIM 98692]
MSDKKILYLPITTKELPNMKDILVKQHKERLEAIKKWEEEVKEITKVD